MDRIFQNPWFEPMLPAAGRPQKNTGKTNASFKGKSKNKALSDQERIAKTLATWTKIGGIKPKNYIEKAANKKRIDQLADSLSKALGKTITVQLIKE